MSPLLPLAVAASLALARTAAAQTPPPAGPPQYAPQYAPPPPMPMAVVIPPRPLPTATLSFSPIHLLMPLFELTAEFRAGERVGVAVLGGAGSIKSKEIDTTFSVYEVGGQFRYYVVGNFRRGLQLGAELLYMHISGSYRDETGVGEGLGLGPFVGYKLGTDAGFMFEAQLGVQRVGFAASAQNSSGSTGSGSDRKWLPLLNLNVGWSF